VVLGCGIENERGQDEAPKKQPTQEHIQMLLKKPSFAPKFDAVYGKGTAATCLKGEVCAVIADVCARIVLQCAG